MNAMKSEAAVTATRAIERARRPACSGNCQQGKYACDTPQACELPDDADESTGFVTDLLMALAIVLAIFAATGLLGIVAGVVWQRVTT